MKGRRSKRIKSEGKWEDEGEGRLDMVWKKKGRRWEKWEEEEKGEENSTKWRKCLDMSLIKIYLQQLFKLAVDSSLKKLNFSNFLIS